MLICFKKLQLNIKEKKNNQPRNLSLIKIRVGIFIRKMSEGKYACALVYRMVAFRGLTLTIYSGNLLIFCNCKKLRITRLKI